LQATDLDGRLIAEAVRHRESTTGGPITDHAAEALARQTSGDLERRIVVRAGALDVARPMAEALHALRMTLRGSIVVGAVVTAIAGAATALTALAASPGEPVNFHWALLGLLGVETLTLLIWLLLTMAGTNSDAPTSLGGFVIGTGRRLSGWLNRGAAHAAMVQTLASVMLQGGSMRWTVGAISHGLWLAFLGSAVAMVVIVLSVQHVTFAWQTTILSADSYVPLTQALAVLPRLAGFPTPTAAEIVASRWSGTAPTAIAASGAWAGLLVGSLVIYGLLPRLILLGLCLLARRRAIRRFRLDLGLPGYLRLRERLMPTTEHVPSPSHAADGDDSDTAIAATYPIITGDGPIVLVGMEIDTDEDHWPPGLVGQPCRDLGLVDSREDQKRVLSALADAGPGLVLIAVSLLTTPDRGVGAFLNTVKGAASAPMILLLTDAPRLGRRYGEAEARQRSADWRRLGSAAGIPQDWIIAFDLADPERAGHAHLAGLLAKDAP